MKLDNVQHYVAGTLLPSMGISGRAFSAEPPQQGGTRSSLYLIRAEGMPPLLLRAFSHRSRAVKNVEALRHLDALRLPAPRLVFHDLSRGSRFLPGPSGPTPFITVETWIEGTRHASLEGSAAGAATLKVAELLARFHAQTREVWGRPSLPVRGRLLAFISYTLASSRRMLRELRARGWLREEEERRTLASFASWKEMIGGLGSFNLVHNDANRHNFVVASAGEIVAVDLHRLGYEPFPEELVNALYHFCRKDAVMPARFLGAYFMLAGEGARSTYEATLGFFEPLNYLKKMYRRATTGAALDPSDSKMARWREIVLMMQPQASS